MSRKPPPCPKAPRCGPPRPPTGASARLRPSSNTGPILEVLAGVAPAKGRALEIASGTGQHIVRLAAAHPGLAWQPSDGAPERLESIRAWIRAARLRNVAEPVVLDAAGKWPAALAGQDLVLAVNLLHLVSDDMAARILASMARALAPGGVLCLYGPFLRAGAFASEGDRTFHAALRAQDPRIGYKDAEWVEATLARAGLGAITRHRMPAANLMFSARKPPAA